MWFPTKCCVLSILLYQSATASPSLDLDDYLGSIATNTSYLEKRVDPSRLHYIDCSPQQITLLDLAIQTVSQFARAGHTAATCNGIDAHRDAMRVFFSRTRALEPEVVAAVMAAVFQRTAPASQNPGNDQTLPVRCAPASDVRCSMAMAPRGTPPRLAYTQTWNLAARMPAGARPAFLDSFSNNDYISMVTICPATWVEVQPLPQRCQPGRTSGMPQTLPSVLFRQLVQVVSDLGMSGTGLGLTGRAESIEGCIRLKEASGPGGDLSPTRNAASYVWTAYLAWRSGFDIQMDTAQSVAFVANCMASVFSRN